MPRPSQRWRARARSASSSATASGSSCSATSSCSRRFSRPTRCWSGRRRAGRPDAELFDLRNVAIETALPAGIKLHLRPRQHRGQTCATSSGSRSRWRSPALLGLAFLASKLQRVRRADRARRRADAQRVPVGVLHAGRMPRPARLGRHSLAADHDGAGVRQGISRRHPAPHPVLRAVLARARHHLGRACSRSSI